MLGYFIESAVIVGVVLFTIFIARRSAVENAAAVLTLLASSAVAIVSVLCVLLFASIISNPFIRYSILSATYLLTFGLVSFFARRRIRHNDRELIKRFENRFKLSPRLNRGLSVFSALMFNLLFFYAVFVFINIVASSNDAIPDRLRSSTVILHRLLIARPPIDSALTANALYTDNALKNDHSSRSLKTVIADTTGFSSVINHIEAARFIGELSTVEKTELIERTP